MIVNNNVKYDVGDNGFGLQEDKYMLLDVIRK